MECHWLQSGAISSFFPPQTVPFTKYKMCFRFNLLTKKRWELRVLCIASHNLTLLSQADKKHEQSFLRNIQETIYWPPGQIIIKTIWYLMSCIPAARLVSECTPVSFRLKWFLYSSLLNPNVMTVKDSKSIIEKNNEESIRISRMMLGCKSLHVHDSVSFSPPYQGGQVPSTVEKACHKEKIITMTKVKHFNAICICILGIRMRTKDWWVIYSICWTLRFCFGGTWNSSPKLIPLWTYGSIFTSFFFCFCFFSSTKHTYQPVNNIPHI